MSRALLALVALTGSAAHAQRTDDLYINPTLLVSSSRLTAMAGASVAIAEGVEAMPTNYAAVAHKNPRRKTRYDWDLGATFLTTPVPGFQDLENDGRPVQAFNGLVEGQAGFFVQLLKFGLGGFGRFSSRSLCVDRPACSDVLTSTTVHGGLVVGAAFFEDQLVVAAGFNVIQADFKTDTEDLNYTNTTAGVAALLRLHRQPFRLGLQYLQGDTAGLAADAAPTIAGRNRFRGITTPHKLTLGGSLRLGKGSERYNRVSRALIDEQPKYEGAPVLPHDDLHDVAPGPWLISAQLDLVFPVGNATTVRPFLFGEAPPVAGADLYVVPRLGAEHELLPKLMRVRAGTWLEPNLVRGSNIRMHATFGFELYLFHFIDDWALSASLDAAPRYFSASAGMGLWR